MQTLAHDARTAHSSLFDSAPVRSVDIGHSRLAYRTLGSGPDVLFVHGWPLHGGTFRAIASALAAHFRCHVFDLPGAGDTAITSSSPLDLGSHPESVRRLIAALGLERYAIVAHDSGGYVARAIAADDPNVIALVLGDTEIPGHVPGVVRDVRGLLRLPLGGFALRNALRLASARRFAYRDCFADLRHLDGEFHERFVAPILHDPARAEAVFAMVRSIDDRLIDALPALHARIRADVLLIWGERDRIFPLRLAREMVRQFPRARLEVIDGGKCFVHDERPEAFASLALPFLREAFARAETEAVASA